MDFIEIADSNEICRFQLGFRLDSLESADFNEIHSHLSDLEQGNNE